MKRKAFLGLLVIGVLAYIKYNNMTPVEQHDVKKKFDKIKTRLKNIVTK